MLFTSKYVSPVKALSYLAIAWIHLKLQFKKVKDVFPKYRGSTKQQKDIKHPPETHKAPRTSRFGRRRGLGVVAFKWRKAVIRRPSERKPWHRPTFPHKDMQYHGRWRAWLPSSEWDRVYPLLYGHQGNIEMYNWQGWWEVWEKNKPHGLLVSVS